MGWFHFDEVFGSMYDMRLGMKDQVITLVDEQLYLPEGKLKQRLVLLTCVLMQLT